PHRRVDPPGGRADPSRTRRSGAGSLREFRSNSDSACQPDRGSCGVRHAGHDAVTPFGLDCTGESVQGGRAAAMDRRSVSNEVPGIDVHIPSGPATLEGELTIPTGAPGVVLFAHGSGSSRHSPRNQYVAQTIRTAGIGTLLFDLLTRE